MCPVKVPGFQFVKGTIHDIAPDFIPNHLNVY